MDIIIRRFKLECKKDENKPKPKPKYHRFIKLKNIFKNCLKYDK